MQHVSFLIGKLVQTTNYKDAGHIPFTPILNYVKVEIAVDQKASVRHI